MKKIIIALLLPFSFFAYAQHVVINQIYGGGGNNGAIYTNDFVELYNPTNDSISLSGWTIQYCAATGSNWVATPLSGSIKPNGYYLIKFFGYTNNGDTLPTPDITGTSNLNSSNGKVALSKSLHPLNDSCPLNDTNLIDLVGYGTANCFEGIVAPSPGSTKALSRIKPNDDTNDNSVDFSITDPQPRNSTKSLTVTATQTIRKAINITISPNPTTDIINITEGTLEPVDMVIIDITGQVIFAQNGVVLPTQINLARYPRGIYLVKISNPSGQLTQRIILK